MATTETSGGTATAQVVLSHVDLTIGGMTCAACASRVEKKLNRMDGVVASVNYATEKASVDFPSTLTPDDLIATVEQTGYTAALPQPVHDTSEGPATVDELKGLRDRLIGSALLAIPVIAMAMVPPLQFDNWQWLSLTLATPVAVWGAWPFHRSAIQNVRHASATMDTLVSMGVLAAYLWSLWALFFGSAGDPGMEHDFEFTVSRGEADSQIYLEVAAGVTVFLLAGRFAEARSKRRAGAALRALLELGARDAAVLRDGREVRVPVEDLRVGEEFVVRPGERIATDGEVVDGTSAVDQSLLTGESVPVEVGPGDQVVGGSVNAGGRLRVRAVRVGSETRLAQLARLVEQAQSGKAQIHRLADRISAVFVPVVISIAVATLGFWVGTGEPGGGSFAAAVAVLIIACPCALGLATPTALLVGTGRGAQLGILIKGPEVLESTRRIDTVLLDKTGTLTTGVMVLRGVHPVGAADAHDVLRTAAAVEDASEHPIAKAIVLGARERLGRLPEVTDFASTQGLGVRGVVGGRRVLVGRPAWLAEQGVEIAEPELLGRLEADGATVVGVAWDGTLHGVLTVTDTVAPTSREAVERLRLLNLEPVLLTGDNESVARAVADELRITTVIAGVLPEGKVDEVRRLQGDGRVVAMVGDGVNDAAALAQADLGIAMGTGTDAAIEASDLTLAKGDLRYAAEAIRLARRTLNIIRGNLFWAFGYNLAALPLAACGLLNPMIAGGAMALSSVAVVTNSLRLRNFRTELRRAHRSRSRPSATRP